MRKIHTYIFLLLFVFIFGGCCSHNSQLTTPIPRLPISVKLRLMRECFHISSQIKYLQEMKKDNRVVDNWQSPEETEMMKKGDCEDGAILIANMMLMSGVPYWRIRLNAGDVQGGGHAWVTYLRESDNQWIILDLSCMI